MSYGKIHRRPHRQRTLEFSVSTQRSENLMNSSVALEKYMNQRDKLKIRGWKNIKTN